MITPTGRVELAHGGKELTTLAEGSLSSARRQSTEPPEGIGQEHLRRLLIKSSHQACELDPIMILFPEAETAAM